MADDSTVEMLIAIVGDGVGDETLRALLIRAGGDVSAAANSFFDGGVASLMNEAANDMPAPPAGVGVGEDVLGTLFKTLEDQGRKLAERDQQLDMASKVCEALVRKLRETEKSLATADADRLQREDLAEVEVQTDVLKELAPAAAAGSSSGGQHYHGIGEAAVSAASASRPRPLLRYASQFLSARRRCALFAASLLRTPLRLTYRLAGVEGGRRRQRPPRPMWPRTATTARTGHRRG